MSKEQSEVATPPLDLETVRREVYVSKPYRTSEQEYRIVKVNLKREEASKQLHVELTKMAKESALTPFFSQVLDVGPEWKYHGCLNKVGEFAVVRAR